MPRGKGAATTSRNDKNKEKNDSSRHGKSGGGGSSSRKRHSSSSSSSPAKSPPAPTPSTGSTSTAASTAPPSDSQSSLSLSAGAGAGAAPQHSQFVAEDHVRIRAVLEDPPSVIMEGDYIAEVDDSRSHSHSHNSHNHGRSSHSHSSRAAKAGRHPPESDAQDPSSNSNDDSGNIQAAREEAATAANATGSSAARRSVAFDMDRNTIVAIPSAKNFSKTQKAKCWINDAEFQFTKEDCMRQLDKVHEDFPNPPLVNSDDDDDNDAETNSQTAHSNNPTPTPAAMAALRGLELFDPDQCTVRQWNCNEALLAVLEEQDFQRSTGSGTVHPRAIKRAYRKSLTHCVRKAYQTAYLDELAVRDYLSTTFDELRTQYTNERLEQQAKEKKDRKSPSKRFSKILLKPFCMCATSKKDATATTQQLQRAQSSSEDDEDEEDDEEDEDIVDSGEYQATQSG